MELEAMHIEREIALDLLGILNLSLVRNVAVVGALPHAFWNFERGHVRLFGLIKFEAIKILYVCDDGHIEDEKLCII